MPSKSITVTKATTTNINGVKSIRVQYKRNQHLVRNMSMFSCATLGLILLLVQLADSIFIPPRLFYLPFHHDHHHTHPMPGEGNQMGMSGEGTVKDVPYLLTINEGNSKSVELNSRAAITVNLNRAVPQNVDVLLSVYSGPNLIHFDKDQNSTDHQQYDHSEAVHNNSSTSFSISFPANTFGDRVVYFHSDHSAGHAEIVCKVSNPGSNITIDDSTAYISVDIYRSWNLNIVIQVVGWIYFFAWSISFYFQLDLNYRRKSVVGLNFDFMALNLLGFTCYAIYNSTLLFSYDVQQEYYKRYTYSRIPVEYNDLFFALHAVLLTLLTVMQCFFYERGEQKVSLPSTIFLSLASVLGVGLYIASLLKGVTILDVVFYLSYVKLVITTIKYGPQAYMNYRRKATTGWSIHNIILDFTGGSFSLLQMLLIAYNYDDWISIFGNFAKFGLGLVSMIFDVIFLVQHYILYANERPLMSGNDLENSSESVPSPVISQSIRSANATQQQAQAEDSDTTTD